jgi:NAD(P)H dehydrogenase (quinone)
VLTGTGHENKIYELTGDVAWTFAEFADEIAKVADRPVTYRNLTVDELAQHLVEQGTPPEVAGFVAAIDGNIAAGTLGHTPGDLRSLIGRPTTPVAEAIKETLKP